MNTEVTNTESLLPGKCRLRFLPASGHAIFVNQSIHNLVLCVFLLKIPYLVFSHSVVSESLWPRGLQHTRLPCPSPSPGACSNSYPLSQWCHPTISSSVIPFSFCLLSFPPSEPFSNEPTLHIRWLKYWGFSFSISPSNEYSGLISFNIDHCQYLLSKGFSRVFPASQFKGISSLALRLFYCPAPTSVMTTGKTIALTVWTFVGKVMSLLFNMLSRFIIAFLPRSKHLLISWLQSPSRVILEVKKIKSVTVSFVSPSICHEV